LAKTRIGQRELTTYQLREEEGKFSLEREKSDSAASRVGAKVEIRETSKPQTRGKIEGVKESEKRRKT